MSTLTLPGLATGIDTSALITQLVNVESRRLAQYQVKQKTFESQRTALESVKSKVSALKSATNALADISKLNIYNTSSSDNDVLGVSASSEANPGSHTVEVNQLATTETWIQDSSNFSYKTDYVGTGTFIYTYNNQSRAINTVANETTLEDLVNLINNDTNNPGVTASLLYHGGKHLLMLSGRDAGENYKISVDSKYTEVWKSSTLLTDGSTNAGLTTKITELDQFTANEGLQGDEKIIISGKNHFGTSLANKEISINSNTTVGQIIDAINEQFDGAATAKFVNGQIVVTDHLSDTSAMEISLTYDKGSGDTALALPNMAVSTEGGGTPTILPLGTFSKTQSAQSSKIKIDGFPTSSTAEIQRLTKGSTATAGTFRLTYNGITTNDINYNATTAEIQAALEAKGITGITVSGDALNESSVGHTNFTFLTSAGDAEMISIDATNLTFSGAGTTVISENTKGNNGYIERNTNSISDALSGVTINLKDVTEPDETVKITISRNTSTVSQKISSIVTAYNDLMTELKKQTEYDSNAKKMGTLSSDMAVTYIKTQARNPFQGIANGFVSEFDSFTKAEDIGISFDGSGMMEFDSKVFNEAINEDFNGVLSLIGANKTSNNESGVIEFYSASKKYTSAGTYDIQVDINDEHQITDVRIKLSTESEYRTNSTWSGNLVTGIMTYDEDGNPIYPENSLQFTVDTTQAAGTYSTSISVKQGIVTTLDEYVAQVLESDGRLDISGGVISDKITAIERKIESEQTRLENYKQRLVDKFARLERTLTMLQQQMSSLTQPASY